jgi:dTDP-4-amino-4,6-dideoxygalactose transaminase
MPTDPYRLGIELFNAGRFFDAHEALEDVWREASGDEREFLQAVIQIAVGLHHYSTGNLAGAGSLMARGAEKLGRYPETYCELRVNSLREAIARWTDALAGGAARPELPRLEVVGGNATLCASVSHSSKRAELRPIPLLDLQRQYQEIREEVSSAMERVCASQQFILGREVEAFEREAAQFLGVAHAVACSSGTDALWLALVAAGVQPGDEVITTPFSFFASASAIVRAGARPVFVDVDPRTLNISAAGVRERSRRPPARLKAILPVHLYGQCANMDALESVAQESQIVLVEDAAQAFGAAWGGRPAGGFGAAAGFSFYPTKNLSAYGDAGCVTTNDPATAIRIRSLRNHGSQTRYVHDEAGWNCRMDALQAAVLLVKLGHLKTWNELRRSHAALYHRLFAEAGLIGRSGQPVTLLETAPQARHIYHQYVIRAARRDELRAFLGSRQIATEVYYPLPLHLQKPFAYLGYAPGDLPEAERAAGEVLALPMFPELTESEQRTVVAAIAEFYSDR